MNVAGYIVQEYLENEPIEQDLVLREGDHLPPGGILDWAFGPNEARSIFPDRKTAREAITRTDHYRLAFAPGQHPDKKNCRIVPVKFISPIR